MYCHLGRSGTECLIFAIMSRDRFPATVFLFATPYEVGVFSMNISLQSGAACCIARWSYRKVVFPPACMSHMQSSTKSAKQFFS